MDFEIEYFFFVAYLATKQHQVGTIFVWGELFFGGVGTYVYKLSAKIISKR